MPTTAVLVHGAWHGAWCFESVVAGLHARGIEAIAVDLPGHGDDKTPLGDLHTDAARVREVLDGLDGDCVLLGHSYGGAVITEAGAHPKVRHMVYVCAFALDGGESCMSLMPILAAAVEAADDGVSTLESELAAAIFYNGCDAAATADALARLGSHPAVTLTDVPAAIAWHDRPSTYVVCTEDQAIPEDVQREMAKRCTTTVDWPTGHSPFLSDPDRMVDLLSDLASQSG